MDNDFDSARALLGRLRQLTAGLRATIEQTYLAEEESIALLDRSRSLLDSINEETQEQLEYSRETRRRSREASKRIKAHFVLPSRNRSIR